MTSPSRAHRTGRPPRRSASARAGALALALGVVLLTGCEPVPAEHAIREAQVDGGTETLVATRGVNLLARPGDVVRIVNANGGPEGRAADEGDLPGTVVHAFAAVGDAEPPPLFVPGELGSIPNPGVWGACRGGTPAEATEGCPVLPIDGPAGWDGSTYWSTGVMLPSETRDVPLSADIPVGTHRLVCALHPELFVDVVVSDDLGDAPASDPAPDPAPLEAVVPDEPEPGVVLVAPRAADTTLLGFWPDTIEVEAGGAVTWRTDGRSPHDVVLGSDEAPDLYHAEPSDAAPELPDGPWDGTTEIRSGYLSTDPSAIAGDTATVTFGVPGTYRYACRFHTQMTGTVVVR